MFSRNPWNKTSFDVPIPCAAIPIEVGVKTPSLKLMSFPEQFTVFFDNLFATKDVYSFVKYVRLSFTKKKLTELGNPCLMSVTPSSERNSSDT